MAVKPRLWTRGFILDTLVNFLIYIIYYMLVVIIASEAIHSLHATVSEAGLAAGIFVLGTLAARLLAGRSVEIYGRKKMLYGGILFYLATTCMYFGVDSLPYMYAVRFLNGIGYGIASTATSTIVSAMIPEERRGEGINYYALSMSLAAAIGPFLGMIMQQFFTFRIIIMFCVAVVLVCLAAAFVMKVDEIRITEERRNELKEISLTSFLEPKVMGISIVGFFVALCYSSVLSFLATYAAELHLMTAGTLFFVVYALSVTIIRPVAGVMFDKKGEDFVMYPTFACLAVGLLILSITTRSWEMLLAGVFVGLGYGTFMSNGQAICVKLVEEVRIGVAVSTYFVMLDLGLGVGPYILGAFKGPLGFSGIYSLVGVGSAACAFLYYGLYAWHRNAKQGHGAGSVEKA
jgi:MFS family permease